MDKSLTCSKVLRQVKWECSRSIYASSIKYSCTTMLIIIFAQVLVFVFVWNINVFTAMAFSSGSLHT